MKKKIIFNQNYQEPFEDRRENSAMKVKDFLTPTIMVTLIIGIMAIGGYKFVIQATADQVKCHTEQIATTDKNVNVIDKKVGKLETEIPNIKESIARIESSQIETQKDIKLLLSRTRNDGN